MFKKLLKRLKICHNVKLSTISVLTNLLTKALIYQLPSIDNIHTNNH